MIIASVVISIVVSHISIGRKIFGVGEWKGKVDNELANLKEFLQRLDEKISKLSPGPSPSPLLRGTSPLSLTELGEEVADEMGAYGWAEKAAYDVWDEVEEMEDYEIHDFCYDYVGESDVQEKWATKVRRVAYERGMTRQAIYDVLAVVLRDQIIGKLTEGEGESTTE